MRPIKEILKATDAATAAVPRHPREQAVRFERVTLEQLDPSHHAKVAKAIAAAREWAARRSMNPGRGLVLIASRVNHEITGYGCGKTHIARACLHTECFCQMEPDGTATPIAATGQFWDANAIIQRFDADTPAWALLGSAGIVVIDDVGTEQTIPFTVGTEQAHERQRRYFKLIDFCYQNGVNLIVTGNLTVGGLADRIGGRAWSRLQELAPKGSILDLTGVPDWRRRQR